MKKLKAWQIVLLVIFYPVGLGYLCYWLYKKYIRPVGSAPKTKKMAIGGMTLCVVLLLVSLVIGIVSSGPETEPTDNNTPTEDVSPSADSTESVSTSEENTTEEIKTEEQTEPSTENKTDSPTEAKTERPTERPTESKTQRPTEAPTKAPANTGYVINLNTNKVHRSNCKYVNENCVSINASEIRNHDACKICKPF